jgi:SAM-dependent methyltransferase
MTRFRHTGMPDWDWWRELFPDPAALLHDLGLADVGSLADVACGNGYFAVPAAGLVETVYAIDLDTDLLDALEAHAAREGVAVEPIEGDARDLPDLLPDPVAAVLLANTFHGVDDRAGLAHAVRESLVPGGRFAVVNWHARPREETTVLGEPRGPPTEVRITPAETRAAVERVGFRVAEELDLEPYHYAVVFERMR